MITKNGEQVKGFSIFSWSIAEHSLKDNICRWFEETYCCPIECVPSGTKCVLLTITYEGLNALAIHL